ncbi:hypothetical protein ABPG75_004420 [Micractinium tetrahymenae]
MAPPEGVASSPLQANQGCLERHRNEIRDALLYMDAGAAEAVAASGGLAALQELGAAWVCDLDAAAPGDLATAALLWGSPSPIRRVALLVTALLEEAEAAVLAACQACAAAAQFTVLCSVSEAAHHDELPAAYGPHCYASVAAAWQAQLNAARLAAGGGPCSLAVLHCPLLLCPLSSAAFVLPASSAAAILPRAGSLPAGYATSAAAAAGDESDDEQQQHPQRGSRPASSSGGAGSNPPRPRSSGGGGAFSSPSSGLSLLAHALVDITAALGLRPEVFSLGPCSRLVANHMAFVPAAAGDAPPAALVLVDRLMDPASPGLHPDLLVPRMFDELQLGSGGSGDASGSRGSSGAASGDAAVPGAAGPSSRGAGGSPGFPALPFAPAVTQLRMPSLDPPLAAADAAQPQPEAGSGASSSGGDGSDSRRADLERGPWSLLPGSLQHSGDPQAGRWLEFLLSRKGRDGQLFIRKWLREAARKENTPQLQRLKPGTSITAEELRSLADALRRQSPAAAHRHAALLQLAEAAAAALEGPHAERWEALQREERQLLFACAESSKAAAAHLADLCRLAGRPGSPLGLSDVAQLLLASHCWLPAFLPWFAGGEDGRVFQPQEEAQLAQALVDAVMAGRGGGSNAGSSSGADAGGSGNKSSSCGWLLQQLAARAALATAKAAAAGAEGPGGATQAGQVASEELRALQLEARDAAEALLQRCRDVAALRRSLLKQPERLGRLAEAGQDGAPRPLPLLPQIAEHILADRPLPDLRAGATSLSGLLRKGLGRFGLQAGPKPSDCDTIILFVLGGIAPSELHEIMQAVDERAAQAAGSVGSGASGSSGGASSSQPKPTPRIIVGASALLRPSDLCGQMFGDL